MKISTEINSIAQHIGFEKAVACVAESGFDAFDLSLFALAEYDWTNRCIKPDPSPFKEANYLQFVRSLKQIGKDGGIICNQAHAPFPTRIPEIFNSFERALECAAEAGAECCVIHPDNDRSAEENAEIYAELLPFAKKYGVKIATENMFNWDNEKNCAAPAACSSAQDFLKHMQAVNDPWFVACLDIGHAEMQGLGTSACEMIHTLGPYLRALHIHDNDLNRDSHQIPFSMRIDFQAVAKALAEIGYTNWLTLEAASYLIPFSDEDVPRGVRDLANAALRFEEMVNEARRELANK